ncbi:MAG TPA: class I SAM-dependent methyltransferase [Thermoplasmata archaeon]|nr:class I SAM-dependent methyltransferase [Thermoplasmata archaeon]
MAHALYGKLAPFYDRIYHWKDYDTEARNLLRYARAALGRPPHSLLDVTCGTGRHLNAFRRRIPRVAGVDASRPMLREARRRLGPSVPLVVGDMRTFRLDARYDVLTCLFSAIGYLRTRRDRDRALVNFYRHLEPGGVVLVEGWIRRSAFLGGHVALQTYEGKDAKIARVSVSRVVGGSSDIEMHTLVGQRGRRILHTVEHHRNALYEPPELLGSFRRAGFRARVVLTGPFRERGLYIGIRAT